MEYLRKLCNKVLTEKAVLKEDTKIFQDARTKHKEITDIFLENERLDDGLLRKQKERSITEIP